MSKISQCIRWQEAGPAQQAIPPQYVSLHGSKDKPQSRPFTGGQHLELCNLYNQGTKYPSSPRTNPTCAVTAHSVPKGNLTAEILSYTKSCEVQRDGMLNGGTAGICPPCPCVSSSCVNELLLWCWAAELKEFLHKEMTKAYSLISCQPTQAGFPALQGGRG